MKAKPFKRIQPPRVSKKGGNSPLTRAQVVALIASEIPRGRGDDESTVRNRVSSRLSSAVSRGKLKRMPDGKFRTAEVGRWARSTWPGKFGALPVPAGELAEAVRDPWTVRSVTVEVVLPGTLERCHARLRSLEAEVHWLRDQLARTEKQLAAEKAIADIHRAGVAKSRRRPKVLSD